MAQQQDIDIFHLHKVLEGLGIPVDSVHRNRDGSIELSFLERATDEQRALAEKFVAAETRQDGGGAALMAALERLPKFDDIMAAKKAEDLKEMALALRAFIDGQE